MDSSNDPKQSPPARRSNQGSGVTMATVGRMAGVSQVTVSRALSDPQKVSADTLKRIHEAIRATGFVPNAIAGALASNKSLLISALVPAITNVVYSSLMHGFSKKMREHGYQIMLSETGFDPAEEEAVLATHLSRRPDGILLTGVHHSTEVRRMLLGARIPVVEIWDITETPIDCCVGFSHAGAGRAVAEFATASGYRKAACVLAGDERARRRRQAFTERFTELNGTEVLQVNQPEGPATLARGRAALRQLLDVHGFDEGVIYCSSDVQAHGVLIEASSSGIPVPERIAVIGFGDQEFAAHTDPALTTVHVNGNKLGQSAANALLARFRGEKDLASVIDVGFKVIRRESA